MEVAIIKLKSYAFLHLGQERWKRVTKRSWDYIPGSAIYGSVACNLIRLDCHKGEASFENCRSCLKEEENVICGYKSLLKNVKDGKIRFSPLIMSQSPVSDALEYCKAANIRTMKRGLTPHAPINRRAIRIHEDQLYGLLVHQPFNEYWGFILANEDFIENYLRRALRLLPVSPLGGGRGKFSQVEATIVNILDIERFTASLTTARMDEVKILTPIILNGSDVFEFLGAAEYLNFDLRKYRIWRTGLYWEEGELKPYGMAEQKKIDDSHQTIARLALINGIKIRIKSQDKDRLINAFLWGVGHKDWTYLGWGQLVFEGDKGNEMPTTR